MVLLLSLLAFAVASPGAAQTPSSSSRLALVIGNSAYEVGRLRNPVNDANDMAATLRELGFEVTLLTDVKHPEMRQAIRDFGRRLGRGGVSVFYFAGHGVRVDGENYLIPVGAGIEVQEEVRFNAVPLGFVLDWMGDALGAGRLNLVLLDACRNNPFPARNRSPTRGLAAAQPPSGTLIAYAAAPGAVADEGGPGERNGRFTKHLLRSLSVPGLSIEQVVKRTVAAVVAETGQGQVPWQEGSLVGEFVPRPAVREITTTTDPGPDPVIVREAAVGELKVTVNQGGAVVRVGSLFEETTQRPETLTFRNVPIGEYPVEVRKTGFETSRQPVRIEPAKTASLSAWLERKPRRPGELLVEKIAGVDFAQRYIPAGNFRMGSPASEPGRDEDETPHDVSLKRSYWMLETEVTQKQWQRLMGTNPSYFKSCGAECPVEQVSWYDAVAFANKMSEQAGVDRCYEVQGCTGEVGSGCPAGGGWWCAGSYTCNSVALKEDCTGWRLPTEAEWESAARAKTETALYTGPLTIAGDCNGPELDDVGWYCGNSGVEYEGGVGCSGWPEKQYPDQKSCGTHPVGQKQANEWELRDMLGNVWEWTGDWFGNYPSGSVTDPVGEPRGSRRVLRGGGWGSVARGCRSADRGAIDPGDRISSAGFRLVRTASE